MLSLTESKMTLLDLAYLFLKVVLPAFEVGSSITLVTNSSNSPSSKILKTLAFQALKFEDPSSLSSALTEDEAILKTRSDIKQAYSDLQNKPLGVDLRRLKSLPQLSSSHALSSDTMLEFNSKLETEISYYFISYCSFGSTINLQIMM
jgi:hypothetical protein